MDNNLTPTDLSKAIPAGKVETPGYNWQTQVRYESAGAGDYTGNSVQTFDGNGKPRDASNDKND